LRRLQAQLLPLDSEAQRNLLRAQAGLAQAQGEAGLLSAQAQMRNAETSASLALPTIADIESQTALRRLQTQLLPQDSEAQRNLLRAQAGLAQAQGEAGLLSAQAQMRNAETSASLAPSAIADTEAQTALRRLQAMQIPLDSEIQRDLLRAQADQARANARFTNEQAITEAARDNVRAFLGAFDLSRGTNLLGAMKPRPLTAPKTMPAPEPAPSRIRRGRRLGFATGTARVPGKGSPKKDTVPAKLAPGEAVLNAAAAEMLGRGLIAALNAQGARQLGMI
jgi:hypothetical protein